MDDQTNQDNEAVLAALGGVAGFDLEQQLELAQREDIATPVHINGVDGNPLYYRAADGQARPVFWYVTGQNSARYRKVDDQLRRRKLKLNQLNAQSLHADNITRIVACSEGWEGFMAKGEPINFTPENARQVLQRARWIVDQLLEAMSEPERFFGSSSS